eukprot:820165_1
MRTRQCSKNCNKKKIEIKRERDECVAVTNKTQQSMIHLDEPIVKQREKEKHELRSETTRKEECLRNIKTRIETKQNDWNKTKQNESILNDNKPYLKMTHQVSTLLGHVIY